MVETELVDSAVGPTSVDICFREWTWVGWWWCEEKGGRGRRRKREWLGFLDPWARGSTRWNLSLFFENLNPICQMACCAPGVPLIFLCQPALL